MSLTEQGKEWVYNIAWEAKGDFDTTHALSVDAAEFWIRALYEEVESRVDEHSIAVALLEFKDEILDRSPQQ